MNQKTSVFIGVAVCSLFILVKSALAQGAAFTYQGQIISNNVPVDGSYDMTFTLYATNAGGVAIAGPVTNLDTVVSNGLFLATVNFGPGVFTGSSNWLQIAVRPSGNGSFTALSPRQQVTPTPYAIYTESAGSIAAADITGTLTATQLPANLVTNTETSVTLNGAFNGDGGGLTNLNSSQIISYGSNDFNFLIGPAGNTGLTGFYNTAMGYYALHNDSSGTQNTAVGANALRYNYTGGFNIALGSGTLENNNSGGANIAIGFTALQNAEAGFGNVAVGDTALGFLGNFDGIGGGSNNIALGYFAGSTYYGNESSNIDIGYAGSPGEYQTIHLGDPAVHTNSFIAGVINGNGSGLTNLSAAQLTGAGALPIGVLPSSVALLGANQSFTGLNTFTSTTTVTTGGANSLNIYGNCTGGWQSPVAQFENKSTANGASPALRVLVDGGNAGDGALSVSVNAPAGTPNCILAEFGNSNSFVVTITNDGTIYSKGVALTSDRNAKENFAPVDAATILDKVASLPVTQWNYKNDGAGVKHIGPVAQDFEAAFRLNKNDDKHISVVDEGGVALAAIKGLNQKLEQKDAEIQELKTKAARIDSLEQQVKELKQMVETLAAAK